MSDDTNPQADAKLEQLERQLGAAMRRIAAVSNPDGTHSLQWYADALTRDAETLEANPQTVDRIVRLHVTPGDRLDGVIERVVEAVFGRCTVTSDEIDKRWSEIEEPA